jgi:phage gpG-like protein
MKAEFSARIEHEDTSKLKEILENIAGFKDHYVKVGVLGDAEAHEDKEGNIIPMVMIASVHEYGLLEKNIPERSFLRGWAKGHENEIKSFIAELEKKIEQGEMTAEQALQKLGAYGEKGVKKQFREGDFEPLKHRDGTPLIDTGQLRASIHWQVVEGNPEEGE